MTYAVDHPARIRRRDEQQRTTRTSDRAARESRRQCLLSNPPARSRVPPPAFGWPEPPVATFALPPTFRVCLKFPSPAPSRDATRRPSQHTRPGPPRATAFTVRRPSESLSLVSATRSYEYPPRAAPCAFHTRARASSCPTNAHTSGGHRWLSRSLGLGLSVYPRRPLSESLLTNLHRWPLREHRSQSVQATVPARTTVHPRAPLSSYATLLRT